jgi:hypothetical protein
MVKREKIGDVLQRKTTNESRWGQVDEEKMLGHDSE